MTSSARGTLEARGALVSFFSGACAGGVVKTCTAPLSRSTILLQTARNEVFGGQQAQQKTKTAAAAARASPPAGVGGGGVGMNTYFGFMRRSLGYLHSVYAADGLLSFWKGNGASILQKMATTGSNYVIYDHLKLVLRPLWASDMDVGFVARLVAGVLAGAFNVTVAYPLDLARTNIASLPACAKPKKEWASILPTLQALRAQHGPLFLTRGLLCTQLCQGLNVGLHFGVYETMAMTRTAFFDAVENTEHGRAPRTTFLHSCACGAIAGLVASTITQPLDLIRRRQQIIGHVAGDRSFLTVAGDIVQKHGVAALYRGLIPELTKVVLFPASGVNFYVYEFVRQDIFGERSGLR